jgi:HTH-type transcriptional regulator/antitoxin HigA
MSKTLLSEKELLKVMIPFTAHDDELSTVTGHELGLELSESDYKNALKRIESLFDVAELGTTEGDELKNLVTLVEEYEENNFPF